MIIGSEKLDAFCRALDNFLDGEGDGDEKARDLVRELAQKVGVMYEWSIWCVYHTWKTIVNYKIASRDFSRRVILDFSHGFSCSFGRDIAKVLNFWDVEEFTYSCKAGGSRDVCVALQGDEYLLDGISQTREALNIPGCSFTDYAFHFRKIKQ